MAQIGLKFSNWPSTYTQYTHTQPQVRSFLSRHTRYRALVIEARKSKKENNNFHPVSSDEYNKPSERRARAIHVDNDLIFYRKFY